MCQVLYWSSGSERSAQQGVCSTATSAGIGPSASTSCTQYQCTSQCQWHWLWLWLWLIQGTWKTWMLTGHGPETTHVDAQYRLWLYMLTEVDWTMRPFVRWKNKRLKNNKTPFCGPQNEKENEIWSASSYNASLTSCTSQHCTFIIFCFILVSFSVSFSSCYNPNCELIDYLASPCFSLIWNNDCWPYR